MTKGGLMRRIRPLRRRQGGARVAAGTHGQALTALAAAGLLAATLATPAASASTDGRPPGTGLALTPAGCGQAPARPGWAACNEVLVVGAGRPYLPSLTLGYTPAQLRTAYELTTASKTDGTGETVAVVEAYNDPDNQHDLTVYRSHFHLPPCTAGCLSVVNQDGQTSPLPTKNNQGWASEQSLDLDMVSAICPLCHILVVEATSQSDANLGAAENTAARLGANAISNSFGEPEKPADIRYDNLYFDHPGIAVTAGSGDNSYGVNYPAASPYVTAVGGTDLNQSSSTKRGWTETAWSGSGSGCSVEEPKPSWQTDPGCTNRTIADVAFDADPYTGVATYDGDCNLQGLLHGLCYPGWGLAGGTSVGAPAIAAIYALAGNTATVDGANLVYANTTDFHDITKGSNGTCTPTYLCTAGPGYDGPTGWGTPNGIKAF